MTKVKHTINCSRMSGDHKYLYISYETDDLNQIELCGEYIEDFANDFNERFIDVPVKPEDHA